MGSYRMFGHMNPMTGDTKFQRAYRRNVMVKVQEWLCRRAEAYEREGRLGDAAPRTNRIGVHSQKGRSQRGGTRRTESSHSLGGEHALARGECYCSLVTRPSNRTGSATKVAVSLIPSFPFILSPRLLFEA